MDVLSDVLRSIRLCGSVFFMAEFTSPWALVSPNSELLADVVLPGADHLSLFHVLLEGECLVDCERHKGIRLESGDVVVFPHGDRHGMRSADGIVPTRLDHVFTRRSPDALLRVSLGGGGRPSRFICGYLNCSHRFAPLFEALPALLIVRRRDGYATVEATGATQHSARVPQPTSAWLATTLTLAADEALAGRPGHAAMLGRLTELMFVEILRLQMQQSNAHRQGWLAALRDPYVGRALRLLHASPRRQWTVDALAHEVAISRSGLAQRFTRLLGQSPIRYLSAWRIQLAKELLCERCEIHVIAERIGYESQPAFNRAFKKATGCPPATWRRTAGHIAPEPL